jgi:hypothetical protein
LGRGHEIGEFRKDFGQWPAQRLGLGAADQFFSRSIEDAHAAAAIDADDAGAGAGQHGLGEASAAIDEVARAYDIVTLTAQFVRHADGDVLNGYSVKLLNHADRSRTFLLSVTGAKLSSIKVIGVADEVMPVPVQVEPDRVRAVRVLLTVAKKDLKSGGQPVEFHLTDPGTHETVVSQTVFVSGEN